MKLSSGDPLRGIVLSKPWMSGCEPAHGTDLKGKTVQYDLDNCVAAAILLESLMTLLNSSSPLKHHGGFSQSTLSLGSVSRNITALP